MSIAIIDRDCSHGEHILYKDAATLYGARDSGCIDAHVCRWLFANVVSSVCWTRITMRGDPNDYRHSEPRLRWLALFLEVGPRQMRGLS